VTGFPLGQHLAAELFHRVDLRSLNRGQERLLLGLRGETAVDLQVGRLRGDHLCPFGEGVSLKGILGQDPRQCGAFHARLFLGLEQVHIGLDAAHDGRVRAEVRHADHHLQGGGDG
jgi:hypothetical protein